MRDRGPLFEEHLVLGARFGDDGLVEGYANETGEPWREGACLADLTHMTCFVFGGSAAVPFVRATFAGRGLEAGECAFEAVLTGDGAIASVPLLCRTGQAEHVVFDASARSEILEAWLSFVSAIEQNGYRPYQDLVVDDATATHATLLLKGPAARRILADYLGEQEMPEAGRVAELTLDAMPAIVVALPEPLRDGLLLLVSPAHARVLWRSLLSFPEVTPIGKAALARGLEQDLGWWAGLSATDVIRPTRERLEGWGLLRSTSDFIGARALGEG